MGDRRELVRGVFAWEGATQLAFGIPMLLVALRYQPLTPLFLTMVIVERGLMSLQGWILLPPSDGHHPPEHYASPVAVVLALASWRCRCDRGGREASKQWLQAVAIAFLIANGHSCAVLCGRPRWAFGIEHGTGRSGSIPGRVNHCPARRARPATPFPRLSWQVCPLRPAARSLQNPGFDPSS